MSIHHRRVAQAWSRNRPRLVCASGGLGRYRTNIFEVCYIFRVCQGQPRILLHRGCRTVPPSSPWLRPFGWVFVHCKLPFFSNNYTAVHCCSLRKYFTRLVLRNYYCIEFITFCAVHRHRVSVCECQVVLLMLLLLLLWFTAYLIMFAYTGCCSLRSTDSWKVDEAILVSNHPPPFLLLVVDGFPLQIVLRFVVYSQVQYSLLRNEFRAMFVPKFWDRAVWYLLSTLHPFPNCYTVLYSALTVVAENRSANQAECLFSVVSCFVVCVWDGWTLGFDINSEAFHLSFVGTPQLHSDGSYKIRQLCMYLRTWLRNFAHPLHSWNIGDIYC